MSFDSKNNAIWEYIQYNLFFERWAPSLRSHSCRLFVTLFMVWSSISTGISAIASRILAFNSSVVMSSYGVRDPYFFENENGHAITVAMLVQQLRRFPQPGFNKVDQRPTQHEYRWLLYANCLGNVWFRKTVTYNGLPDPLICQLVISFCGIILKAKCS